MSIVRDARRMLAAWALVSVYLLVPAQDRRALLALAHLAREIGRAQG